MQAFPETALRYLVRDRDVVVLGEIHPLRIRAGYFAYYNGARCHLSLGGRELTGPGFRRPQSKLVHRSGQHPLPTKVIPMPRELLSARVRAIGGEAELHGGFVSDNGNVILDVAGLSIRDPADLERDIEQLPGVATAGPFANPGADVAAGGVVSRPSPARNGGSEVWRRQMQVRMNWPRIRIVTRAEVQRLISEQRAELAKLGIRTLDIFGSVARGEASPGSDVDLLIEFDRPVGLFHFFRVQRRLEQILGCRVDLVMREAVKPQLRDQIFREAVRAT